MGPTVGLDPTHVLRYSSANFLPQDIVLSSHIHYARRHPPPPVISTGLPYGWAKTPTSITNTEGKC